MKEFIDANVFIGGELLGKLVSIDTPTLEPKSYSTPKRFACWSGVFCIKSISIKPKIRNIKQLRLEHLRYKRRIQNHGTRRNKTTRSRRG